MHGLILVVVFIQAQRLISTCSNITPWHIQRNVWMLLSWLLTRSSFLQIVNQSVEKVRNGNSKDANSLQKRTSMLKKSAQSGPAHCLPFDVSIMHSGSNAITTLICSSIIQPIRAIYRAPRAFCARSRWVGVANPNGWVWDRAWRSHNLLESGEASASVLSAENKAQQAVVQRAMAAPQPLRCCAARCSHRRRSLAGPWPKPVSSCAFHSALRTCVCTTAAPDDRRRDQAIGDTYTQNCRYRRAARRDMREKIVYILVCVLHLLLTW